jgi:uncharacterized protein
MDDGIELAATLYLPDPSTGPQPCILEALPYRKDDLTASYRPDYVRFRDDFGYAVCRLDLRGTGSSGGDAVDEYPPREQQDLGLAIDWLATQDWCDGNIGMYGTSYSGFNSLQMACEQPPYLKAIISIYASDNRYTDDVHYRGGIRKLVDLLDYCHYMTPMSALPPVPALWGSDWREEWRHRIDVCEPWLFRWLDHQLQDAYWRHGSVRPDYGRITCPTMLITGWADGYTNIAFRLVEQLRANQVPHRLLAGPWSHAATDTSQPGPRIDSVPAMAAWWDRWLRGIDNGVGDGLDESPAATCFVRSSTRPSPVLDTSNGEWITEAWPSPRVSARVREIGARVPYRVRPDVGVDAWIDCAGHLPWGQSDDQRFDDAASLTWQWDAESVVLLGHPRVALRFSVDAPTAYVSVKLCDVFEDGTSSLVCRGTRNLGLDDDLTEARQLEPGIEYEVDIELDACAYRFDPGHRLRLAIAGADWPNTVAPPRPVTLTVQGGRLELPVWDGPSPYEPPALPPGSDSSDDSAGVTWRVERDVLGRCTTCVIDHGSRHEGPYESETSEHYAGRVSVDIETFEQRAEAQTTFGIRWPDARVSVSSSMDLTATADSYAVSVDLIARDGTEVVGRRHWQRRFPRIG